MTKRDELDNPNSCLNKAADDEMLFVLRSTDLLSPETVRGWAIRAEAHGCPPEKLRHAYACAEAGWRSNQ